MSAYARAAPRDGERTSAMNVRNAFETPCIFSPTSVSDAERSFLIVCASALESRDMVCAASDVSPVEWRTSSSILFTPSPPIDEQRLHGREALHVLEQEIDRLAVPLGRGREVGEELDEAIPRES
jgi:hypothetical protein